MHVRPILEFKNTLNLPKTSFAMKANLPQREPEMLKHWEKMGIYATIRTARAGAPSYVLHDGPPYANCLDSHGDGDQQDFERHNCQIPHDDGF